MSVKTHITEGRDVAELLKEIEDFVKREVSVSSAKRLLLSNKGTLYSKFPSGKVWEWAEKKIEEYFGVNCEKSKTMCFTKQCATSTITHYSMRGRGVQSDGYTRRLLESGAV